MAKHRHYSPAISRFVVSALYHEAQFRGVPMTKLTDTLLSQALRDTEGWRQAETLRVAEDPTPYPSQPSKAA